MSSDFKLIDLIAWIKGSSCSLDTQGIDETLALDNLKQVHKLLYNQKGNHSSICEEPCIDAIVILLDKYLPLSEDVTAEAIGVMGLICRYGEGKETSNEKAIEYLEWHRDGRALEAIVEAMQRYPLSASITKHCCMAIRNITFNNTGNNSRLGNSGACDLVVQAMKRYVFDPVLVQWTLGAMLNLAVNNPDNTARLGEAGGCEAATQALQKHRVNHPVVAQLGCLAIVNMSNNEHNQRKLGDAGACELIVKLLQTHIANPTIAQFGCWAVVNLAIYDNNNLRFRQDSASVSQVVYQVLKSHVYDVTVVLMACNAIHALISISSAVTSITTSHLNQSDLHLQAQFGELGIAAILIKCLHSHSSDCQAIKEIFSAVRSLAVMCEGNQEKFGQANACEILVELLKTHIQSEEVCLEGCRVILNLAYNDENQVKLFTAGCCEVLVEVLQFHLHTSLLISVEGCGAIRNLAYNNAENIARLGSIGAGEVIVNLLQYHIHSAQATEQACGAIVALTLTASNVGRLGNVGACTALVQAVTTHCHQPNVAQWGCIAIGSLASHNPDNKTKLGKSGVCPAIARVINCHMEEPEVIKYACVTAYNLMNNLDNRKMFLATDIVRNLKHMKTIHGDNTEIVNIIDLPLSKLETS